MPAFGIGRDLTWRETSTITHAACRWNSTSGTASLDLEKAMTTYGSVCSGIEAASVAWHPLGWRASWFAEIEPFPSAVLAHRWPEVPNLGDMTKLARQVQLLKSGLSPKSVNEIFTVVRGVWADAYGDGILKSNPLDRVKNVERDHDDDSADPFTREELELIAKVETTRQQDITMILFDCWAGLSVSELIGLGGMMWIWRQGRTSTTRARRLATS